MSVIIIHRVPWLCKKLCKETLRGQKAETQLNIGGAKGIYLVTLFNSANGKQTVSKIVLQ
jgi:hypothetical protein